MGLMVKTDGTYPQGCHYLLNLVHEQVLDIINEEMMLMEYSYEKGVPDKEVECTDIKQLDNAFINKGYRIIRKGRTDGDIALYKHDFSWYLIKLMERRTEL